MKLQHNFSAWVYECFLIAIFKILKEQCSGSMFHDWQIQWAYKTPSGKPNTNLYFSASVLPRWRYTVHSSWSFKKVFLKIDMWHDPLFPISKLWMLFVVSLILSWKIEAFFYGEYSILTVITFNLHGLTFLPLEIRICLTDMMCVWNHPCFLKKSQLICVALYHLN